MATNALPVDWGLIEKFMLLGGTFKEASEQFKIKQDTLRKRAMRYQWPLHSVIAKTAKRRMNQPPGNNSDLRMTKAARLNAAIIEQAAETWDSKGEAHRKVVFELAHQSLKKMKPQAPKNFREAEAADKMARRAAGLENIEQVNQTLIQINDAVNGHDVVEAEIVDTTTCSGVDTNYEVTQISPN